MESIMQASLLRQYTANVKTVDAALAYAKADVSVFPAELGVDANGKSFKRPYTWATQKRAQRWGATRDPEQIRKDFDRWPHAAVCIPTGIENDFFVVEADTPKGHDVDGIANLKTLIAGREWPETRMAQSPTGSRHHYFAYPLNGRVRNRTGKNAIAPGVDVLGDGGMVVAPPSIRPDVGEYVWLNPNVGMKHAPQWLLDIVTFEQRRRKHSALQDFEINVYRVIDALDAATNDKLDEDVWFKIMAAAYAGSAGHAEAFKAFVRWSQKSFKHKDKRTVERWRSFDRNPPRDIGPGSLYAHANATAPGWREASIAKAYAELAEQYAAGVAAAFVKTEGGRHA
jgi:hypothetical protein